MRFLILLTLGCLGTLNQEATAVPELVTGTIIEQIGHSTILVEGILKLVIKFQAPLKLFSQILQYEEMLKELGQAISNLTDLKPSHERLFIGTELARMLNIEIEGLKGKIDTLLKFDWVKPNHDEAPPVKQINTFSPKLDFKLPIRDKRGAFDLGGIFLNSLFGLATEGDLKAIDQKLDVVAEAVKASNTAMIQLNHNEKYIKDQIEVMKDQLNKQAHTIHEIEHLRWLNERYILFKFQLLTMEKFFDFLLKLDEEINALIAGSQGNSLHLIPRTLFPFEMFKRINSATEEKLNMKSVAPLNRRNFPYYLNAARIFPGTKPMTMLMIIPYATEKTYDTYKFHSFPTFHKDIPDYRVLLDFKLPYMLLSSDLKTITHLDENDFRLCTHVFTPESTYLCFLSHPLYSFPLSSDTKSLAPHRCQEKIIRKGSTEECTFLPYPTNDTLVKRVGPRIYLSSIKPLQAVVNCPTGNTQPLLKELTILAPGCSFTSTGLSLLNFREVNADVLVQLSTHEIPLLDALEYSDKFPMETANFTPVIGSSFQDDLIRKKIEESEKLLDKAQNMPKYVPMVSGGISITTLLIICGVVIYLCLRKEPRYSAIPSKTLLKPTRGQTITRLRYTPSLSQSTPNISEPSQLEMPPMILVNPPVPDPPKKLLSSFFNAYDYSVPPSGNPRSVGVTFSLPSNDKDYVEMSRDDKDIPTTAAPVMTTDEIIER